jgi:hypothetical protein
MTSDYRYGLHDARATFGNGQAGERLSEIVRHLADHTGRAGLCGITANPHPISAWLSVAQRIQHAPICADCYRAGEAQEASIEA